MRPKGVVLATAGSGVWFFFLLRTTKWGRSNSWAVLLLLVNLSYVYCIRRHTSIYFCPHFCLFSSLFFFNQPSVLRVWLLLPTPTTSDATADLASASTLISWCSLAKVCKVRGGSQHLLLSSTVVASKTFSQLLKSDLFFSSYVEQAPYPVLHVHISLSLPVYRCAHTQGYTTFLRCVCVCVKQSE